MAFKPCLPVAKKRKQRFGDHDVISFESIDTMDASEYLSLVVQQSNRLPEVLLSKSTQPVSKGIQNIAPIEGSVASFKYLVSGRTAIFPPPSPHHVPTYGKEWVGQTLANFSQLRLYLEKYLLQSGKMDRKQAVPAMKDLHGWHIFCLGAKEAQEEPISGDEEKHEPGGTESSWLEGLPPEGYTPSTSLILQLDQVMVKSVIAHLVHYVQEGWDPSSARRSQWIYSLLSRLEKPIHRNDAAVLYSLLKALTRTRARATLTTDREGLARVNVLITIVGLYFEQGGGYASVMEP